MAKDRKYTLCAGMGTDSFIERVYTNTQELVKDAKTLIDQGEDIDIYLELKHTFAHPDDWHSIGLVSIYNGKAAINGLVLDWYKIPKVLEKFIKSFPEVD